MAGSSSYFFNVLFCSEDTGMQRYAEEKKVLLQVNYKVKKNTLSMMGMTASRSLSVILLDTESFMSMLSISATPAEYISDSRLQHAIRPKHVTYSIIMLY